MDSGSTADISTDRTKLEELRANRLDDVIERVWSTPVPFYERKLREGGVDRSELGSTALSKIPTTIKEELRSSEQDHPPFGDYRGADPSQCVRLLTSGGTSGRPTASLYTPRDGQTEVLMLHRGLRRAGIEPGVAVVHAHPGYLMGAAQFQAIALESYGALSISLGPPSTDDSEVARQLEFIATLQPEVFFGYAPALIRYREVAAREGLTFPRDFGITKTIFLEPACQLDGPREWFEQQFDTEIFVATGMVEVLLNFGSQCRHHDGVHINEDHVVIEVLEVLEDGERPVEAGERGHLVFTTLGKDNFTLRFDSQDIGYILEGDCPCGEVTRRHVRLGRRDDITVVDGRPLLPIDILASLTGCEGVFGPEVLQFQMVRSGLDQPTLPLLLEMGAHNDDLVATTKLVETQVSDDLGVTVDVRWTDRAQQFTYKPSRVVGPEALEGLK
jgi:phenylacetate-CoA ligase